MNIPNKLTLLRITLIPVFVLVFYLPVEWNNIVACIVFVVAAVTDMLDGYLARKLNQTSKLGAFLDPVADKLMIAVALVLIVERQPTLVLSLPVAVIICREITVSALREWMAEIGSRKKVAVSILGKIKTISQMVAVGFLIYNEPLLGLPVYQIGLVLIYVAAILTLVSMIQYLRHAWPDLKD